MTTEDPTDPDTTLPTLEGRRFAATEDVAGGEVDTQTVFHYRQDGPVISGSYQGGRIRLGYLVGTREASELDFRYVHINTDGETASGRCRSRIEVLDDGRLRMHEAWQWESQPGHGTSIVEELHRG